MWDVFLFIDMQLKKMNLTSLLKCIAVLLVLWGMIIFLFNILDLTPNVKYTETFPLVNDDKELILFVDMEYSSKGAFIAGEDNPIDLTITVKPGFNKELYNKIEIIDDYSFWIKIEGARSSEFTNELVKSPPAFVRSRFTLNNEKDVLFYKTKIYYPNPGEYSPEILFPCSEIKPCIKKMDNIVLSVSKIETGLQLINNSRILSLTLILLGMGILQFYKKV